MEGSGFNFHQCRQTKNKTKQMKHNNTIELNWNIIQSAFFKKEKNMLIIFRKAQKIVLKYKVDI